MRQREVELIPTRQTLLTRLRDVEDQQSWKEFFDIYWRLIYRTAIKAGLTDFEGQEVVQETVISVCRKMPGFEYDPHKGSFKSWLLQLTSWRIEDQRRKRKAISHEIAFADATIAAAAPLVRSHMFASDPAECWESEWEKNIVAVALERVKGRVDPRQYQMFDLSVFQEWPVKKIAQFMGVRSGTVYLTKHRLRLLLRMEIRSLKRHIADRPSDMKRK